MNSRPNIPGGPAPGRPEEDLDGVLGRFQNWAQMHRQNSAVTNLGNVPESPKLIGGAREVSYEQALRASRYRRPVDDPSPVLPPIAATAVVAPVAAPEKSKAASGKKMAAAPKQKSRSVRKSTIAYPAAASPVSAPAAASRSAEGRQSDRRPSPQTAAGRPATQTRPPTVEAAIVAVPARKRSRPAFEQVLRESAAFETSGPTALATLESAKTVSLTLRMAEAEHARIQARAAFASLSVTEYLLQCALGQSPLGDPGMTAAHERQSVSAYLRHCAAGIDELRERVEAIASVTREEPLRPAQPPAEPPPQGFWQRMGGRIFRRSRGDGDYSSISLR